MYGLGWLKHYPAVLHSVSTTSCTSVSHFEIAGNVRYFLAKVTDFGKAQFVGPRGATTLYAAPEFQRLKSNWQLRFTDSELKKMDVYSSRV